jgi:hypothetical protein
MRRGMGSNVMNPKAFMLMPLAIAGPAAAQQPQPNVPLLAQALDRCMATQAVRLTHTTATDADIYAQASRSCLSLSDELRAAIRTQLPPAQASEILGSIDAQAETNFSALLSRIRSDRARRAGN